MQKKFLKRDLKQMLVDNPYNILISIYELFYNKNELQKEFPGSPVIWTRCSLPRQFNPGSGNSRLQSAWCGKKKKNFRKYIPQKRYNNKFWEDECQEKRKFLSVNTQSILKDTKVSPLEFTCFSLAKNSLVSLENYNTSHVH